MLDLGQLRQLLETLRTAGVRVYRDGDLAIELGPPATTSAGLPVMSDDDANALESVRRLGELLKGTRV